MQANKKQIKPSSNIFSSHTLFTDNKTSPFKKAYSIILILITIITITFLFIFLPIKKAQAEQIKTLSNDSETTAIISNYDLSRVKIINDKIKTIRYNNGELSVAEDNELGEIYIRPTNTGTRKNINLFLISERGNVYKLLLVPKKVPSEQIFIKHRNSYADWTGQGNNNNNYQSLNFDDPYKSTIITLIKSMTSREPLSNFTIEERNDKIKFRRGLKLKWEISYLSNNLTGEIFSIKNISKKPITINEEDFLTRGILAVKVDKLTLNPKEITSLYLVGGRYGRE
ncbi:type-F conjugative transfer system secretin TraK [Pseudomonadota bacterium]